MVEPTAFVAVTVYVVGVRTGADGVPEIWPVVAEIERPSGREGAVKVMANCAVFVPETEAAPELNGEPTVRSTFALVLGYVRPLGAVMTAIEGVICVLPSTFVAVIVCVCEAVLLCGVPDKTPLRWFKNKPGGNEGDTENDRGMLVSLVPWLRTGTKRTAAPVARADGKEGE